MPSPRQEASIAHIVVPVTAELKQWMKSYARAQNRTMSAEIRHMIMSLYLAEVGPAKELIG